MKKRPEVVLTESMVIPVVQVVREEHGDAAELIEEEGGDVVLLGGVNVGAERSDVEDFGVVWKAGFELEG